MHSVSQRPNLRHLGEPLGGAKSLQEAVSFKKATEGMGRGRVANARWERVPPSGGCNTETTGGKCSANTRNEQQLIGLISHSRRVELCQSFLARDSMLSALYAIARPSVRLSVRPSVTRVDQSKKAERIIEILSPSDRPNILVFRHQRSLRKSDGFTPNWGAKYKGGSKN